MPEFSDIPEQRIIDMAFLTPTGTFINESCKQLVHDAAPEPPGMIGSRGRGETRTIGDMNMMVGETRRTGSATGAMMSRTGVANMTTGGTKSTAIASR